MPYNWTELLQTLAEVNIAILGFSGIIGAVWTGRSISLNPEHRALFRWMLDYSLIALTACLIPFLVFPFFPETAAGWQSSSVVYVLAMVLYFYLSRNYYRVIYERVRFQEGRYGDFAFVVGDFLLLILLVLNAGGWLFEPGFKAWLLLVMWNMLGAITGFVRLIYATWEIGDE